MKITIEVNVPEGVDLDHTYQAVTDALYLPQSVTQLEYNLVANILNSLASKKSISGNLSKGFREWAETHHEIVCTIHAMIDNNTIPPRLEEILDKEGFGGLYNLGISLTNEFSEIHENTVWDGDWIDTIIEYLNLRLR